MKVESEEVARAKRVSLKLVVSCLFLIVLAALYYITNEIVIEKESAFDDKAFAFLNFSNKPQLRGIMLFFTFFGSSNFLLPAYILLGVYYFFRKRNTHSSLNISAVGLSSALLLRLLKNIFRRHRPEEQLLKNIAGFSYPSGHSLSSFTFCGLLIYITWQSGISKLAKWIISIVLVCFASMIALSRVYFRVHFPSDVLAGFLLSIVWLTICYWVLVKWRISERLFGSFSKRTKTS